MSTVSYAAGDSLTMLRRNLKHARRYPAQTFSVVLMPVTILLLFDYAYGGTPGAGIGGGGRVDHVTPGIVLMAATAGSLMTAVGVCVDMTGGIVNRFRTMAIAHSSFLAGHVLGSLIRTAAGLLIVAAAAFATGFRPDADALEWLAAGGLLLFVTLALTWVSVGIGLAAGTPESAGNLPLPLQFLPFVGSATVPPDSMPTALRRFAEYQPFTPLTETLRGLLTGTAIGSSGVVSLAWCTGLTAAGYLWARAAFRRPVERWR
ncbi:ABC transporter permease [Kitasatospora sp. NPDC057500]|uniref:ABC transporter permease n=1 Tax=Kitasatospora sp. NPDC057500 TaxID=3346151 RepID=UPI0036CA0BA2